MAPLCPEHHPLYETTRDRVWPMARADPSRKKRGNSAAKAASRCPFLRPKTRYRPGGASDLFQVLYDLGGGGKKNP